MLIRCHR